MITANINSTIDGASNNQDRLGNVAGVTNAYGSVASLYTMDAFGNVLEKGNGGYLYEHTTDPQPYHLTTKEYDPDARLYYFSARWYDPETGRFISLDTLRDGANFYILAYANPARGIDPSGSLVVEGGTEEQRRLVRDAFKRACHRLLSWPSVYNVLRSCGQDPIDAYGTEKCLIRCCKKHSRIMIKNTIWCRRFDIQGHDFRLRRQFWLVPTCTINLCPRYVFPDADDLSRPSVEIDVEIMHELFHSCDNWCEKRALCFGEKFR